MIVVGTIRLQGGVRHAALRSNQIAPRRVCGLSRRGWEIPAFFVIGNVTGPRCGVCK